MKINWKAIKVVIAFVIVIGAIFWAVTSVRSLSYSGTNLNFGVGSGPVSVTNPSEQPIPVQMVGAGSRSFRVSSTIEGVSGSSTREGSGSSSTQLFEFALPSGSSEVTISRGTNVNFVANTETNLVATVQPVSGDEARITIIAAAVVVLGALFYASRTTGHRWISAIRGHGTPTQDTKPVAAISIDAGQGSAIRSYGDNHSTTGR